MIVAVSVGMAVGKLRGSRLANLVHLYMKVQIFSRQGVIQVHIDNFATHFMHGDQALAVVGVQMGLHARLELPGVGEVFLGHPLNLIVLAQSVAFSRRHHNIKLVTGGAVRQRLLQAPNHITVPMQQCDRIIAQGIFEHLSCVIAEPVTQQYHFIFFDFHSAQYTRMRRLAAAGKRARSGQFVTVRRELRKHVLVPTHNPHHQVLRTRFDISTNKPKHIP